MHFRLTFLLFTAITCASRWEERERRTRERKCSIAGNTARWQPMRPGFAPPPNFSKGAATPMALWWTPSPKYDRRLKSSYARLFGSRMSVRKLNAQNLVATSTAIFDSFAIYIHSHMGSIQHRPFIGQLKSESTAHVNRSRYPLLGNGHNRRGRGCRGVQPPGCFGMV